MSSTDRTSRPTHFPFLLLLALQMLLCATTHAQRDSPSPPPPGYEFRANFNPSMAVIIVVILSAFFCMAFFALYVRRCGDDDHVTAGGAGGMTRQAKKGLDKAVVESFPTMVYSEVKGLKIGKEGTLECAVCLCEFDDDETLRLLPKCSHAFHPECIDMWLDSHTTCPVCRANLAVPGGSDPNGLSALGVAAEEDQELGNRSQEEATVPPEHVLIAVEEEVAAPAMPGRSRSARVAPMRRLPMWTEEEKERFTLRLPEGVTKEVMRKKRLDRSATMAFPVAEGRGRGGEDSSVCRGYRVGGGRSFKREWAARSDRWAFLARTLSLTKAHKGSAAGGKGESSGEASAVGNLDRV